MLPRESRSWDEKKKGNDYRERGGEKGRRGERKFSSVVEKKPIPRKKSSFPKRKEGRAVNLFRAQLSGKRRLPSTIWGGGEKKKGRKKKKTLWLPSVEEKRGEEKGFRTFRHPSF